MIKYYIKGTLEDEVVFYSFSEKISGFIIHHFTYSIREAKIFKIFVDAQKILKNMPNTSFKICSEN